MPDKRDVHVESLLTGLAIEYANSQSDYIASRIVPMVPVVKLNDKYATYNKQNRYRVPRAHRAPKTESKEVDYGVSSSSYALENYALHVLISDEERENADPPFNLDMDGTEVVTDLLLNDMEDRLATLLLTAASYTSSNTETLAGTDQWSDPENSTPIQDVNGWHETVKDNSGKKANKLIIGWKVWSALKLNSQILNRVGSANLGIVTLDLLRTLFDVDEVVVGGAQQSATNPGQSTQTISTYTWGNDALLAYVNTNLRTTKGLTLAAIFKKGDMTTQRFRIDGKKSDKIEVDHSTDEVLVAQDAGYLAKSAVA